MEVNSASNARHAIQNLLDGNAPNGIAPADCGAWADTVQALFDAHAAGGSGAARKAWDAIARTQPGAAQLVAGDGTAQAWGPILPFHNADLPAFPLDIFPTWLREFCEAVTEAMQTPPDLAGMLALSVLSTACARRVAVRARPGWDEPVNVYTVTSLPPGSRKSPVFRAMMGPIVKFEQDISEKTRKDIADAEARRDILKQRIEEAKRQASKTKGDGDMRRALETVDLLNEEMLGLVVPTSPKLVIDDVTPETVSSILADQGGRVSVLSSEGDIFAIMAGRYSSGAPNIGVYKKGHAGEDVRVDRKTRSEHIKNATITIGVTTQPEVLRTFGQNSTFRSEGLLARFFYALPVSTVGSRKVVTTPIPDHIRSRYFRLMLELLESLNSGNCGNCGNTSEGNSGNTDTNIYIDISNDISILEISTEASNSLIGFETWLEPQLGPYGAFGSMADWFGKLAGAVLRVAGLLHMADEVSHNSQNSQNTISDATMRRALRFAHYLMAHAQAAYAEIGADPAIEPARSVLRWIDKAGARIFTKRDCYQGVKGTLKRADELDPVLTLLCDHGYLREVENTERAGPGRKPSPQYEVNPVVFETSHNSHNSQNTTGAAYAPPADIDNAAYEPPTFRAIEGY